MRTRTQPPAAAHVSGWAGTPTPRTGTCTGARRCQGPGRAARGPSTSSSPECRTCCQAPPPTPPRGTTRYTAPRRRRNHAASRRKGTRRPRRKSDQCRRRCRRHSPRTSDQRRRRRITTLPCTTCPPSSRAGCLTGPAWGSPRRQWLTSTWRTSQCQHSLRPTRSSTSRPCWGRRRRAAAAAATDPSDRRRRRPSVRERRIQSSHCTWNKMNESSSSSPSSLQIVMDAPLRLDLDVGAVPEGLGVMVL